MKPDMSNNDKFIELLDEFNNNSELDQNRICEETDKRLKQCKCVKCTIRKRRNKKKEKIGIKTSREIKKLVTYKLRHTPIDIYSIYIIKGSKGTLSRSNLTQWKDTGLLEEFYNEFLEYLVKEGQIQYAFDQASINFKGDSLSEWTKIISYQFKLFLYKKRSVREIVNLERRTIKILKQAPFEEDPRYLKDKAYRFIGDNTEFRDPTEAEIKRAVQKTSSIKQEKYNPESTNAYRVYSTDNLKSIVEVIVESLKTSLPRSKIRKILTQLGPLDSKDSISSLYETIKVDSSQTIQEVIGESDNNDLQIIELEFDEDTKKVLNYMKLKIENNMNTALTTLNKTHEDPLKILQKCLQWIINTKQSEEAILQRQFCKEVNIPERSFRRYKKALVNILDDTYEQFNHDRTSLSAALFQISNMDI